MAEYRFKVEPYYFVKGGIRVTLQRKVLGAWWRLDWRWMLPSPDDTAEEGVERIKKSLTRTYLAPHPGERLFGIYPVEKETDK